MMSVGSRQYGAERHTYRHGGVRIIRLAKTMNRKRADTGFNFIAIPLEQKIIPIVSGMITERIRQNLQLPAKTAFHDCKALS